MSSRPPEVGFTAGLRDSLPVVGGYVPACLTFGAVGTGLGLDPLPVFLLSALLYAGASQFIAVQLLSAKVSAAVVLVTILLVNLRYVVLARALGPRLEGRPAQRALLGAAITEEVYAVLAFGPRTGSRRGLPAAYVAGAELPPYLVTLLCTAVGIVAGRSIPTEYLPALTTSLYALVICLVLPPILADGRTARLCALAAVASVLGTLVLGPTAGVLAAMGAGALFLRFGARSDTPVADERNEAARHV